MDPETKRVKNARQETEDVFKSSLEDMRSCKVIYTMTASQLTTTVVTVLKQLSA